jgi:hypothetical protein
MTRARAFKRADLTRAVRAVEDAGHRVSQVEIDKAGKIIVTLAGEQTRDVEPANVETEWRVP